LSEREEGRFWFSRSLFLDVAEFVLEEQRDRGRNRNRALVRESVGMGVAGRERKREKEFFAIVAA